MNKATATNEKPRTGSDAVMSDKEDIIRRIQELCLAAETKNGLPVIESQPREPGLPEIPALSGDDTARVSALMQKLSAEGQSAADFWAETVRGLCKEREATDFSAKAFLYYLETAAAIGLDPRDENLCRPDFNHVKDDVLKPVILPDGYEKLLRNRPDFEQIRYRESERRCETIRLGHEFRETPVSVPVPALMTCEIWLKGRERPVEGRAYLEEAGEQDCFQKDNQMRTLEALALCDAAEHLLYTELKSGFVTSEAYRSCWNYFQKPIPRREHVLAVIKGHGENMSPDVFYLYKRIFDNIAGSEQLVSKYCHESYVMKHISGRMGCELLRVYIEDLHFLLKKERREEAARQGIAERAKTPRLNQ